MAALRSGLLGEIVTMSLDTLRTNKMRSALTVLGVVIGITSIVGMTSLIRGFDNSLRDSISQLGPNTIIVQKWGALSFASGKSFLEVARRPNLSREDALAIARDCPSVASIDVWLGSDGEQPVPHLLRTRARRSRCDPRRDGELGGGQLREAGDRAGSSCPPKSTTAGRSSCSGRTRGSRCSRTSIRSAKRCGSAATSSRSSASSASARARRLFNRRRRLRGDSVQRPREVLRQGAQGLGEDLGEQLQSGGVPHGDDRGRPARRHARRRRCAKSKR